MKSLIGFVGLGIMGAPMCRQLIAHGYSLLVYDIDDKAAQQAVSDGAKAASLAEIGSQCEIIFTILPNGAVVKEILFGEGGVAKTLVQGSIAVDMSSVKPSESTENADRLAEIGVGFLDAPVSGGEPKAIDGTLVFMVGGERKDYDRVLPFFEAMGSSATLVGPTGSGSVAKLVNQAIVNLNIAVISEALVFAAAAGAKPDKVYEAIRGGLAGSAVLDAKAPMIFERNFKPGGKISINHKDIGNVLDSSHNLGVPMPLTAQLYEIMQYLKRSGGFEEDHASIVKYFETLGNITV